MKKKLSLNLLILVTILLLVNLSLAQPTKSTVEIIEIDNQVMVGETATFQIKITNTAEENQRFSLYSIAHGFDFEPVPLRDKIVSLNAGETYKVKVHVKATEDFKPGIYYVSSTVESDLGEKHNVPLKLYLSPDEPLDYIPAIKATIDMDDKIDPKSAVPVTLFLENRNPLDLTGLSVRIQSDIPEFVKQATIDLPPLEKRTVEFTITPNEFQQPKEYFLFFVFERGDEVVKVIDKKIEILSIIPEFKTKILDATSFLKITTYVEVFNDGNVINTQKVKLPVSFLSHYFVSEAKTEKIEGQNYAVWDVTLGPNEIKELNYVTNYRVPFFILLFVLLFIGFAYYVKSPIVLRKRAVITKSDDEGALSEVKVTLEVVNKLRKPINDLEIIDLVPAIANVEKSLELGTLKPHAIKHTKLGTKVVWSMAEIDGLEHRLITYKVKAKLNILGTFSLPRASLHYKKAKGKKGKVFSNIFRLSA